MQDMCYPSVKMLLHSLSIGVECFFVISGFLIVYLLLVEKEQNNKISLSNFYIRRALRIFPLHYLIIIIAYYVYHLSNPEINFAKFAYFCGNFAMIETDKWTVGILNPLWSLAIEEHFYLVIPVLILYIPIKKVNYLFFGVILLSLFFRCYAYFFAQWMTFYCHTLSRMDSLAIGGLIAYYYHRDDKIFNAITSSFVYIAAIYLVLLMSILDISDYTLLNFALFKKYLFLLPIVIIFTGFVLNNNSNNSIFEGIKRNKIVNYLGKISFGLYMYHYPIYEFMLQYDVIKNHKTLFLISAISITILVSTISYELFEKQILKLKKRFEVVTH